MPRSDHQLFYVAILSCLGFCAESLHAQGSGTEAAKTDKYGDALPKFSIGRFGTVRWRHSDLVQALAFHADGKTVVSASSDGTVRIWDTQTGSELRRLAEHDGLIGELAFDAVGDHLAGASCQHLYLWDYRTGKLQWSQEVSNVWAVALSSDGSVLATSGGEPAIDVWDTKTGKKLHRIEFEKPADKTITHDVCGYLSFSKDGRYLAAAGAFRRAHVWDTKSYERVWSPEGDRTCTVALFSPDGKHLLTESADDLCLWSFASRKLVGKIDKKSNYVMFSRDGKILAVRHPGEECTKFWNIETKEKLASIGPPVGNGSLGGFSPDGRRFAWCYGSQIRILDILKGEDSDPRWEACCLGSRLDFSPDGKEVVVSGYTMEACVWNIAEFSVTKKVAYKPGVSIGSCSPDGRFLVLPEEHWEVYDTKTKKVIPVGNDPKTIPGPSIHRDEAELVFLPDASRVAVGGKDGRVWVWDLVAGREVQSYALSERAVTLACSQSGRYLAVAGVNGSLDLLDLRLERQVLNVASGKRPLFSVSVSWDGKFVAAAREDGCIQVWEVSSGKLATEVKAAFPPLAKLREECPEITYVVAFSPDDRVLAYGGMKEFASLRDLSSGKNVTLRGHQAQVVSLAFAPSGRELATLSSDTTALLWDWRGALPAATKTKAGSSAEAIERAWEELASLDSNRAFAAIWELGSTQEETLRLIGKRLKPIAAPDLERLSKLTADLNSDEFDVRKHASDELRTLGELAEAQLRRLVKDPPSKEALGRAQELLKTTQGPYTSGEKLRALRAIIVLEQIGTPESIAELKRIAKGAPEARVTQDAELALERLEHQSKHK